MKARATTTVDVHRDADATDVDGYGDETETAGAAVYSRIPFSLIERTRLVPDASLSGMVPVSIHVGRCGSEYDIRRGDRVQDVGGDGAWYAVADVAKPQSPVGTLDRRLTLRRA